MTWSFVVGSNPGHIKKLGVKIDSPLDGRKREKTSALLWGRELKGKMGMAAVLMQKLDLIIRKVGQNCQKLSHVI